MFRLGLGLLGISSLWLSIGYVIVFAQRELWGYDVVPDSPKSYASAPGALLSNLALRLYREIGESALGIALLALAVVVLTVKWHDMRLRRRVATWYARHLLLRLSPRRSALAALVLVIVSGSVIVKVVWYDAPAIQIKNLLFSQTLLEEAYVDGRNEGTTWPLPTAAAAIEARKGRILRLMICSRSPPYLVQPPSSQNATPPQTATAVHAPLPNKGFGCDHRGSLASDTYDRQLFRMFLAYFTIALLPFIGFLPYRIPPTSLHDTALSSSSLLQLVKGVALVALTLNAFMLPFYYAKTLLPQDSYLVSVKCGHCKVTSAVELPVGERGFRFYLQESGEVVEVLATDVYERAVVPPTTDLLRHRIQHFLNQTDAKGLEVEPPLEDSQ